MADEKKKAGYRGREMQDMYNILVVRVKKYNGIGLSTFRKINEVKKGKLIRNESRNSDRDRQAERLQSAKRR